MLTAGSDRSRGDQPQPLLAEFFSIVTSAKRVSDPRTPEEAVATIEAMLAIPGVTILPATSEVTSRWLEMLSRHPVRGGASSTCSLLRPWQQMEWNESAPTIVRTSRVSLAWRFSLPRLTQPSTSSVARSSSSSLTTVNDVGSKSTVCSRQKQHQAHNWPFNVI